jgi:glutamine synthetase
VLSERELESRYEVSLEQYTTTINIEGETAAAIARTMLLPAAISWLATLGTVESAGIGRLRDDLTGLVDEFIDAIYALDAANAAHPEEGDALDAAKYVQGAVIEAMGHVREVADKLERVVPDDIWPLPKYSEVLLIK